MRARLLAACLLAAVPEAAAADRVPARPARVTRLDRSKLQPVPAVESAVQASLTPVPDSGIRMVPARLPILRKLQPPRKVTPGENGVPLPPTFEPPATGTVVQHGRTLEAPVTQTVATPVPTPALPAGRRDSLLADLAYLDVPQGMNSAYPNGVIQDRRDYLWITTWGGGLARYDGVSFVHFTTRQGLLSNNVFSVLEDRQGRIWIGTDKGLTRYDGSTFTHFTTRQGLPSNQVMGLLEDRLGSLWLATDLGLCRFRSNTFTTYGRDQGVPPTNDFLEDREGALWLATNEGAIRFDGRSFTTYAAEGQPALLAAAEDGEGKLWFGGGGLARLDEAAFTVYTREQGLPEEDLSQIRHVRDGSLWLATRHGAVQAVRRSRDEARPIEGFVRISEEQGLSHDRTSLFFEDSHGFLWIGTLGGGLARHRADSFRHVTVKEGLSDSRVWTVLEARDGALWFATDRGACRHDGKSFAHLPVKGGAGRDQVHAIYQDRNRTLWFGTAQDGIYRWDGQRMTHVVRGDGAAPGRVWAFQEDREGGLWIAAGGGAQRFDGRTFTRYGDELLGGSGLSDVLLAPDGSLWFTHYRGGVSQLVGDTVTTFDRTSGLPTNDVLVGLVDRLGRLWLGTREGVVVHEAGQFLRIGEADGLSHSLVVSLAEDPRGAVWVGTERGLNRIELGVGSDQPRIATFSREEGLLSPDFNQQTGLFDRSGRGYWGTGRALSMLPPGVKPAEEAAPPRLQLTGLDLRQLPVDYRALDQRPDLRGSTVSGVAPFAAVPDGLVLPHDLADLTFHFSAVDWTAPHKLEYQSMLLGARDWGPPGREPRAVFQNLAAGSYVFRARARLGHSPWGDPVELAFAVRPPWWQTWWARGLWLLLALGGVASLVQLRVRALRQRQAELERQVVQRTQQIAEQKREIEVQNESITASIRYAERIQQAMLPVRAGLERAFPDSCILFLPRDIVSGDFYWMAETADGTLLAAVDCTGHGVPGAFLSMLGCSLLEEIVKAETDPARVLELLHQRVVQALKQGQAHATAQDGMDVALLRVRRGGGATLLDFAGARRPLYVVQEGRTSRLDGDRKTIGGERGGPRSFHGQRVEAAAGAMLYLCTDGFSDQLDPAGKRLGTRRLQDLLARIAGEPGPVQREALEQAFAAHRRAEPQLDDVTVIGVRVPR